MTHSTPMQAQDGHQFDGIMDGYEDEVRGERSGANRKGDFQRSHMDCYESINVLSAKLNAVQNMLIEVKDSLGNHGNAGGRENRQRKEQTKLELGRERITRSLDHT